MSVTYVGGTFARYSMGDQTVPYPLGVRDGDVLVIFLSGANISANAGWTALGDGTWWRLKGASDTSVLTSVITGGDGQIASLLAYRDALGVIPAAQYATAVQSATMVLTAPAVTNATTDGRVVHFGRHSSGFANPYATDSSGFGTDQQRYRGTAPGGPFGEFFVISDGATAGTAVPAASHSTNISAVAFTRTVALASKNLPPNAPTVGVPAAVDLTSPLVVNVEFSDPNPGDSASQSLIRYRRANVTPAAAWAIVSRQSPQTQVTIPADTLTAGDYELQGASRDAAGLPVADADLRWSVSAFFTASTPPPGPVFTSPAAGATIITNVQEFVVSIPALEALEWRVLGDVNGAADPATVINAGGIITTGDLRRFTATGLPNSTTVHAQARAKQAGLFGPWTTTTNLVSFTPPAVPGFALQAVQTVAGSSGTDAIRVTPSIPTPAAGQPATAFLDIFVRRTLQPGGAQRKRAGQQPSSPWTWLTPAAGVDYEVQVVAVASNGTRTASAWSGATAVPVAGGTSNAYDTAVYDTATYA